MHAARCWGREKRRGKGGLVKSGSMRLRRRNYVERTSATMCFQYPEHVIALAADDDEPVDHLLWQLGVAEPLEQPWEPLLVLLRRVLVPRRGHERDVDAVLHQLHDVAEQLRVVKVLA